LDLLHELKVLLADIDERDYSVFYMMRRTSWAGLIALLPLVGCAWNGDPPAPAAAADDVQVSSGDGATARTGTTDVPPAAGDVAAPDATPAAGADTGPTAPLCSVVPYAEAAAHVCAFYECADAHIAGGSCSPQGYVIGFACKYADRYLAEVYPTLSPAGQTFLEEVYVCLQQALLPFVEDPEVAAATTCEAVAQAGFGAHVPCYMESGFCALPADDVLAIARAIDAEDLQNPLQQAATTDILAKCAAESR